MQRNGSRIKTAMQALYASKDMAEGDMVEQMMEFKEQLSETCSIGKSSCQFLYCLRQ